MRGSRLSKLHVCASMIRVKKFRFTWPRGYKAFSDSTPLCMNFNSSEMLEFSEFNGSSMLKLSDHQIYPPCHK